MGNADPVNQSGAFAQQFNSFNESIRIVGIFSSTCQDCSKSYSSLGRVFDRFGSSGKLKSFVLWKPGIPSLPEVRDRAGVFLIPDEGGQLGRLFSDSLGVKDAPLHALLLYPPRLNWEGENQPPPPASWMHHSTSLGEGRLFDETKLAEETKFLIEAEDPEFAESGVADVLMKGTSKKKK